MRNIYKILLFGLTGELKSERIYPLIDPHFKKTGALYAIGAEFLVNNLTYQGRKIVLQVVDLGPFDSISKFIRKFSMGSKGAIALYDTTDISSLDDIAPFFAPIRSEVPNIPIILIGSKFKDLSSSDIDTEYVTEIADINKAEFFFTPILTSMTFDKYIELLIQMMDEFDSSQP
jgi:GTPase SAR1 family protein